MIFLVQPLVSCPAQGPNLFAAKIVEHNMSLNGLDCLPLILPEMVAFIGYALWRYFRSCSAGTTQSFGAAGAKRQASQPRHCRQRRLVRV